MLELIARQSALSVCKEYGWVDDEDFIDGYNTAIKDIREAINELPTVESKPVQHGRWINDTFCSECKRFPVPAGVSISEQVLTKYFSWCPHCGAIMDGGVDND